MWPASEYLRRAFSILTYRVAIALRLLGCERTPADMGLWIPASR